MFVKKYGDIIVAAFFLIFSAVMIVLAKQFPKSAVMEIGPEFMPLVIGGVTFILAAILMVISIKDLKLKLIECEGKTDDSDYKRVLTSFLSVLVYVFVLQPVGFIISTIVYLPVQMYILAAEDQRSKKDIITLCIISVVFTFAVFFLFRYGFKIVLPAGIFTINL